MQVKNPQIRCHNYNCKQLHTFFSRLQVSQDTLSRKLDKYLFSVSPKISFRRSCGGPTRSIHRSCLNHVSNSSFTWFEPPPGLALALHGICTRYHHPQVPAQGGKHKARASPTSYVVVQVVVNSLYTSSLPCC
jgi:hypothetical protein